jgi:hypothetical protein
MVILNEMLIYFKNCSSFSSIKVELIRFKLIWLKEVAGEGR